MPRLQQKCAKERTMGGRHGGTPGSPRNECIRLLELRQCHVI